MRASRGEARGRTRVRVTAIAAIMLGLYSMWSRSDFEFVMVSVALATQNMFIHTCGLTLIPTLTLTLIFSLSQSSPLSSSGGPTGRCRA